MQFDNDSAIIIRKILPIFTKCATRKISSTKNKNELLKAQNILYRDISAGEKHYNSLPPPKAKILPKHDFISSQLFGSSFVPEDIRQFIKNNGVYQLEYKVTILDREIIIRIMLFEQEELFNLDKYEKYISYMCNWLYICIKYSTTNCSKSLEIFFYPTNFKKKLPQRKVDLIGVENVNSAVTMRCQPKGEIIIYRKEEWRKVFIHETFHAFGLDIDKSSAGKIHQALSKIFPVESKYSVEEAYAETWARIINAAFSSYYSMKEKGGSYKEFILYLNFSLHIERLHSGIQMRKIMSFTGLDYDILTNKSNSNGLLYREDINTNVFGYYVLSSVMMNCFPEFLSWCKNENMNLFKFHATPKNIVSFTDLINACCKAEQCHAISGLYKKGNNDKYFKTNTRMSAIEILF